MGATTQDRAGDGQAAGDGRSQGGGEGAGRDTARFVVTDTWVPGSSLRLLPDGSVVRWVTNEGVLLDYAIRLRGALDDIKRLLADDILGDERVERAEQAIERWGV